MEPNVQTLMNAEFSINKEIKAAHARKTEKLNSVKDDSKAEIKDYEEVEKSKYEQALKAKKDELAA